MASIFKVGKQKSNKRAPYMIEYVDHTGKRRRKRGFTDKALTQQLAAKLEHDVMLRREGLVDPKKERQIAVRQQPIGEHIAEFEKALKRRGSTEDHVKKTLGRVRRVIKETGIETVNDIQVTVVEAALHELRETDGIGHRTYNHYVQAFDSFCRWLVPEVVSANPLAGITKLNAETDVRHRRRALSTQEVAKLIESARDSGEEIQTYDGELRARLYLVSFLTGLRRSELASLTPASFNLTADQPTVTVEAKSSKHRKRDVLPLHPELVSLLSGWLPSLRQDEPLFPKLATRKAWLMVKLDLERVGIPYKDKAGVADFHAAGRHSYVTELLRSGASLPEAKELARHSDVRMTMKYTHIGLDDQADALASLPAPVGLPDEDSDENGISGFVSNWDGVACHDRATPDAETAAQKCTNPGEAGVCDDDRLCLSSTGDNGQKWRIGDLNP